MSIKSTFQELQAGRIKRYEDLAKRQAREKVAATFANVGGAVLGSVINDALRNTTQNFISSAPVMNERIQFKLATKNANRINNIQSAIDQSGKTTQQYFFDTHRESFEEQAKNALAEREGEVGWRQIAANPDVYDSLLDQEMKKLSEAMATNHNEAFGMVSRLGTQEEFDAAVALATRNAKPSNVASLIGRQISNMFTGKSSADYEAEALAAIQNSQFSGNAKALNAFMEEYERKGNIVSAYNYAQFVEGLKEPEDRVKEDTEEKIFTVGSGKYVSIFKQATTTKTDRFTGETKTETGRPEEIWNSATDDPQIAAQLLQDAMAEYFNYAEQSRLYFTGDGKNEFARRVLAEFDRIGDYSNPGQYEREGEIFSELAQNINYVPNERLSEELSATADVVLTEALGLQALTTQLQMGEISREEYERRMKVIIAEVPFLFDAIRSTRVQSYEDLQ